MLLKKLSPQQLTQIKQIVANQQLPISDIDTHIHFFALQASEQGDIMGVGGLEVYRPYALLRSVVTLPTYRGQQVGTKLVAALEQYAQEKMQLSTFYLLTTTAAPFFEKLGYLQMERSAVPTSVQQSEEFRTLCPASAVCMGKEIGR